MTEFSEEGFLSTLNAHNELKQGEDYWHCGNPDCDAFIAEGDISSSFAEAAYKAHQAAELWKTVESNSREEWNAGYDGGHPESYRTTMDLRFRTREKAEDWLNGHGYVIGERNYFLINRRVTEWEKDSVLWGPPGWGPRDQQEQA